MAHYGTPAQQEELREALDTIAASSDTDFASFALWSRDTPPSETLLADMIALPE